MRKDKTAESTQKKQYALILKIIKPTSTLLKIAMHTDIKNIPHQEIRGMEDLFLFNTGNSEITARIRTDPYAKIPITDSGIVNSSILRTVPHGLLITSLQPLLPEGQIRSPRNPQNLSVIVVVSTSPIVENTAISIFAHFAPWSWRRRLNSRVLSITNYN